MDCPMDPKARGHQETLRRITRHMTSTQDLSSVLGSIASGLVEHAGMLDSRVWLYLDRADCDYCREHRIEPRVPDGVKALHMVAGAGVPFPSERQYHVLPVDS